MHKMKFILGIHNHQPVGNFPEVLAWAFRSAYKPFLDLVKIHKGLKIVLHLSGILWDWIESNEGSYIEDVSKLVKDKRLEFMTGGYYEPILSMLNERDGIGQIRKMSVYIKKRFGQDPAGMWLAERVWENQFASWLNQAGVGYTVLDDTHFKAIGMDESEIFGSFLTEYSGRSLTLFPNSERLRYMIPFYTVGEVIDHLKGLQETGVPLVVMADDGEKFGVWPDTDKLVYKEKWLENFFSEIEKNSDWLEMTTFSEYIKNNKPVKLLYLPDASYCSMMNWSMPTSARKTLTDLMEKVKDTEFNNGFHRFLRAGFWKNFLVKYPEINDMHKKMCSISEKIYDIACSKKGREHGGRVKEAYDELYKSQCNCAYWHGVFGGLYLPHLRHAVYSHILRAESIADSITSRSSWLRIYEKDFNYDGFEEIMISSKTLNIGLSRKSGAIYELSFKPRYVNFQNTLTRREEEYHRRISSATREGEAMVSSIHEISRVKEEGLERYLSYDWYRRLSLIDHFLHPDTTLKAFRDCHYGEQGDFINSIYEVDVKNEKNRITVMLERAGNVWVGNKLIQLKLQKDITVELRSDKIMIVYRLKNMSKEEIPIWFGSEFNLYLSSPDPDKCYYSYNSHRLAKASFLSSGQKEDTLRWDIYDGNLATSVKFIFGPSCSLWYFPLETISQSEGGFEKTYQQSVIFPNWRFILPPSAEKKLTIETGFEAL